MSRSVDVEVTVVEELEDAKELIDSTKLEYSVRLEDVSVVMYRLVVKLVLIVVGALVVPSSSTVLVANEFTELEESEELTKLVGVSVVI